MKPSQLLDACRAAQDKGEAVAAITAHIADPDAHARIYLDHPREVEAIQLQIRAIRGLAKAADAWIKTIKERAEDMRELAPPVKREALTPVFPPDAPDLVMPIGFDIDEAGVYVEGAKAAQIAHGPVVITGSSEDVESGKLSLTLAWMYRGQWRTADAPRGALMDHRQLLTLTDRGLPITSHTARALAVYLGAFEAANTLPHRQITTRMGWHGRSLVVGPASYGPPVDLHPPDGMEYAAEGWAPRGDFAAWVEAIGKHATKRPAALLAIYAAAVAPLLTPLGIDGFCVDWSGATSRGKSTTLKIAASVWGDPARVMGSWATASAVGPQEIAAHLHSLPLILDDTKRAEGRPHIVAGMLYDIPAGRERIRGQAGGGIRRIRHWRTVLLSTGERALTDFTEDAGARARALCMRGTPFGKDTDANRRAAEAVVSAVYEHNGHLGAALAAHLATTDADGLKAAHRAYADGYAAEAAGSVSRRLASSVGALRLAADLCHDLGCPGTPKQRDAALALAWDAALASGADSDRPAEAMRHILSWAASNVARFDPGGATRRTSPPYGGWAGRWEIDTADSWDWLYIQGGIAKDELRRAGFDGPYCVREWERRGWTIPSKTRATQNVRVAGPNQWCYAIPFAAVEELAKKAQP